MGKLTLQHIAPYLPYGLKCHNMGNHDDDGTPIVQEIIGLDQDGVLVSFEHEDEHYSYCDTFPLLRLMSDLTKEEWLKVFRSCFSKEALEVMEQFNLDVYLKPNSGTVWLYDVDKGMSFIVPKDYFIAYSINSKSIGFTRGYCFDTLNFFKELYKLHADIDGLIEKGLAIDISMLESEAK